MRGKYGKDVDGTLVITLCGSTPHSMALQPHLAENLL